MKLEIKTGKLIWEEKVNSRSTLRDGMIDHKKWVSVESLIKMIEIDLKVTEDRGLHDLLAEQLKEQNNG